MMDLVKNKRLKNLRGSPKKKDGPVRPSNRDELVILQDGSHCYNLPEGGDDITPDELVVNINKEAYTVRYSLPQKFTNSGFSFIFKLLNSEIAGK